MSKEKIRYYDKKLTKIENNLKIAIILLTIFLLGFLLGALINSYDMAKVHEKEINHIQSELDYTKGLLQSYI